MSKQLATEVVEAEFPVAEVIPTKQSLLYSALASARAEVIAPRLDGTNPHFKSKYVTLAGLIESLFPVLSSHGIHVLQVGEAESLLTIVTHKAGGSLEFRSPMPPLGDLQKYGSALTYQRRYALASLFSIAGQEDDDANSAERVTRIGADQVATLTELGDTLDWDAFIAYCRKMKWIGHADGVESMLESNYAAALNALQKKLRQQQAA
jgi:hypothetical protein|tara:strand:+ start:7566 stop:8189 length:624 start_codon:yes stop_codon:yes gene_type:complete